MTLTRSTARLVPLLLCLGGCLAELPEVDLAVQEGELSLPIIPYEIRPLRDPLGIGDAAQKERTVMVANARDYQGLFGHRPPPDVLFERGDRVLFFAAGEQPTTGFEAKLVAATQSVPRPNVVEVRTRLDTPGEYCDTRDEPSTPFAAGVIRGPLATSALFVRTVVSSLDCSPCDLAVCEADEVCEVREVVCVRAPCPPIAVCEPADAP